MRVLCLPTKNCITEGTLDDNHKPQNTYVRVSRLLPFHGDDAYKRRDGFTLRLIRIINSFSLVAEYCKGKAELPTPPTWHQVKQKKLLENFGGVSSMDWVHNLFATAHLVRKSHQHDKLMRSETSVSTPQTFVSH